LDCLYVERYVAHSALTRIREGLPLQVVGDSQALINCLLGRVATKTPDIGRSVRLAHTALRTLTQVFGVTAYNANPLAQQVPRSNTSADDAAANRALYIV